MIKVTLPNLPKKYDFIKHIDEIFDSKILTNNGPKVRLLEKKLSDLTDCKNVVLMSNGTVTLYALLKSLPKKGKVITTPFSYIATVSAIVEAGHIPVFCDIAKNSTNISPHDVEKLIDDDVVAIQAVHCYGNHCDVGGFDRLSKQYNIPVFYDAAHAFLGKSKSKSILNNGLASSVSFHATKIFNCVEGGAVFTNDDELANSLRVRRNFGLDTKNQLISNSLNFKLSEFHAAMGLALFDRIRFDHKKRYQIFESYSELLPSHVTIQLSNVNMSHTISYLPVTSSKYSAENMERMLLKNDVMSRRYFSPPLDEYYPEYKSPLIKMQNSNALSSNILCIPFHHELTLHEIQKVCEELS